jgi:hypothetical protein
MSVPEFSYIPYAEVPGDYLCDEGRYTLGTRPYFIVGFMVGIVLPLLVKLAIA